MRTGTTSERLARLAAFYAPCLIVAFILSFTLGVGCNRARRAERRAERHARIEGKKANEPTPIDGATDSEATPNSSAQATALLQDMVKAYSELKRYSDRGYVEVVCELEQTRQTRAYRTPCEFSFARPNYARLRFGSGRLQSDGKTLRATIESEAYAGRRIERSAPLVLTSIKEFYPDAQFAEAASLGIPSNVFWTSPQLVLLFAKDPLKTLVPEGATTALLPPAKALDEDEDEARLCDRVQVTAEDGARVYWIDRSTKALARCELPIEQISAPEHVARVVSLRLEFPSQTTSTSPESSLSNYRFGTSEQEETRTVERLLPPELELLDKRFPLDATRKLDDLDVKNEPIQLNDSPVVALCFWRASDPDSLRFNAFQTFGETSQYFGDGRVRFIAASCDEPEVSDETLRAELNASGLRVELARFDAAAAREHDPDFPAIVTPGVMLLDASGVVQKYSRAPTTFLQLQRLLANALDGRQPGADELNAYYDGVRRFAEFVETAEANDVYRSTPEVAAPKSIPARQFPKTFGLRERWRFDDLHAPSNPLAVSKDDRAFQKTTGSNASDASVESGSTTDVSNVSDAFVPLAPSSAPPGDLLVVPCDGNALALLAPTGRLIRKTTPGAAVGEPISFVRSALMTDGRRYYAASSSMQSRKLHRLNENFDDLGTLDVGSAHGQWVGDAQFADSDGDGEPELILGLLGDPNSGESQTHGVYSVDMKTQKIRWKNESLLAPGRLGVVTDKETGRAKLYSSCRLEGVVGAIVALDASSGEQLGEARATANESTRWFATSDNEPDGCARVVAITVNGDSGAASFVGFGESGAILWQNAIPYAEDAELERIVSGDVDEDGHDEWLVVSPDGVIRFFDEDGAPIDVFQYGEELSGVCVARWSGETFLIVADLKKVSAWKIEQRRARRLTEAEKERRARLTYVEN